MKAINLLILALSLSSYTGLSHAESLLAKQAKEAVKERLIDPESATFKIEYEDPKGLICGQVNAKNRLGGYTGFSRFMYTGKKDDYELRMVDPTVKPSDGLTPAALDNLLVENICSDLAKKKKE